MFQPVELMMMLYSRLSLVCFIVVGTACFSYGQSDNAESLASWNDGQTKSVIVDFVRRVTAKDSPDFVPEGERIAVFDNDGTLWVEQPMYIQLVFALDRVKELAADHPEWKTKQPFKAALEGDFHGIAASGEKGVVELIMATHAGMTNDEFSDIVANWLETTRHPKLNRPYTQCVYQPMLELLKYLSANGFKTIIVSAGGVEFMRVFAERVYGIPPEQTFGSSVKMKYELRNGKPAIIRLPEIDFVNDKANKPVGIQRYIGRRPIMAFGNSDGDFEMIEYVTAGEGPSLGAIVHHTDPVNEYAYDRDSVAGRLVKGLDEAESRRWLLIDMKSDWKQVFP
ncbi:MAG: HAD family hydrolase [Pirellulaceae bacterium]